MTSVPEKPPKYLKKQLVLEAGVERMYSESCDHRNQMPLSYAQSRSSDRLHLTLIIHAGHVTYVLN